jgi:hypothetical protein
MLRTEIKLIYWQRFAIDKGCTQVIRRSAAFQAWAPPKLTPYLQRGWSSCPLACSLDSRESDLGAYTAG